MDPSLLKEQLKLKLDFIDEPSSKEGNSEESKLLLERSQSSGSAVSKTNSK